MLIVHKRKIRASTETVCKGHSCDKMISSKASTSSDRQAPNSLGYWPEVFREMFLNPKDEQSLLDRSRERGPFRAGAQQTQKQKLDQQDSLMLLEATSPWPSSEMRQNRQAGQGRMA